MSNTKPITYKNKTYASIKDLAAKHNIQPCTLSRKLNQGLPVEDAIKKSLKNTLKKTITYENKTYNSIITLAREHNIKYTILRDRLIRKKWSVKKAINTPVGIIYKNKTYNSLRKLCKEKNLPYMTILYRTNTLKWSIEKAIDTPIKNNVFKNITYQNKTYDSLKGLAKEYKIPYYILIKRLNKQKWSIKKAIETPITPHPPKGFKIIKSAYTYNNINYYECIHNNQKYILSIQEMKNFTEK